MRYIKLAFISIVFFAVLITIFSLFFPSHVRISRAIDINSSREIVKKNLPSIDSVNARTKSAKSTWNILDHTAPNTVTVQWYVDFKLGWLPWQKFSGLLLENSYGPMMENGLERLKRLCE